MAEPAPIKTPNPGLTLEVCIGRAMEAAKLFKDPQIRGRLEEEIDDFGKHIATIENQAQKAQMLEQFDELNGMLREVAAFTNEEYEKQQKGAQLKHFSTKV